MMFEPLGGWRQVNVTARRTKMDFAGHMKELVDEHFPEATKITVVMDNLNTHRLSTLYEAFEPAEARRLINKIEVVHTPKHGSWLNMAECELSVLEQRRWASASKTNRRYATGSPAGPKIATIVARASTGSSLPRTHASN